MLPRDRRSRVDGGRWGNQANDSVTEGLWYSAGDTLDPYRLTRFMLFIYLSKQDMATFLLHFDVLLLDHRLIPIPIPIYKNTCFERCSDIDAMVRGLDD